MANATVEQILLRDGPCLTSRLCAILEKQGITAAAARQRVSRAQGKVKRLEGLLFPHRARFAYHEKDFNSERYWTNLLDCLSTSNTAYIFAIDALRVRGGIVPLNHFSIICGAPFRQKGHIAPETIIERLSHVRILKVDDVEGIGRCVFLAEQLCDEQISLARMRARLVVERVLLSAVRDWAKNLGLASYNSIRVRDEQTENPQVGNFHWDLTGPSYLISMRKWGKDKSIKPGFLVCDVVVTGNRMNLGAASAFIKKTQMFQAANSGPTFFPILIADGYDREAFLAGRSSGLVMGSISSLFGQEVAKGIDTLLRVLTQAASIATQKPEVITEIFEKLSSIEGAAKNLRGPLFELIVGYCVKRVDEGSVDIAEIVTNPADGKKAEIDVIRTKKTKEIWCYECKGYNAGNKVTLAEVETWIIKKIPTINGYIKSHSTYKDYKVNFEFWTTSSFEEDALSFLTKSAHNTKKYNISFRDGASVKQYAAQASSPGIIKVLDEQYFFDPLTKIVRKHSNSTSPSYKANEIRAISEKSGVNRDDPLDI